MPTFDTTYKGGGRSKNTCELYITNWSYSYKVGIVFDMYQRMRSKGKSWAGPCHIRNYIRNKRTINNSLLLNVHMVYYMYIIYSYSYSCLTNFLASTKCLSILKTFASGNLENIDRERELKIESFMTLKKKLLATSN